MFKLMIAEDESAIRNGIIQMTNWELIGIQLIGAASNGTEALEMIQATPPDLLITDIRMPEIDGLELVSRMREIRPDCICILLTGHNDFTYAQAAVKAGAFDFILKPSSPEEIIQTLLRAMKAYNKTAKLKDDVTILEERWRQHLYLVESEVIGRWMHAPKAPGEDRLNQWSHFNTKLLPEAFYLAVISINIGTVDRFRQRPSDWELIRYSVMNVIGETLSEKLQGRLEVVRDSEHFFVLFQDIINEREIRNLFIEAQHNLNAFLDLPSTIGISAACQHINYLHVAYKQAIRALESRFMRGNGEVFFFQELDVATNASLLPEHILREYEQFTLNHLREGQNDLAADGLEEWFRCLKEAELFRRYAQRYAITFSASLIRFIEEQPQTDIGLYGRIVSLAEQIGETDSIDELQGVMQRILQQAVGSMNLKKKIHRTVQQALELIHAQYASNLMLKSTAESIFVSPNYLSSLFKQEMGINFLDYLHQYRVDQAKLLLMQTDAKIGSVAQQVGYFDEAHFARTFKKWTTQSPSLFQKGVKSLPFKPTK
ncbi:response regulator [Paenibacillus alba]|uniref:Response regulator n=1 Tax=Paenibacillus alba TaxID=1197127 RepID=A0ABU6GD89_9BACL|nr:response regulator [Paenibacillus alba]MEC0232127.1 response regulator [Paenibacillus alba]